MHPETTVIASHMREFGSHILGRAIYDTVFSEMMRPYSHSVAVTLAVNAAEIIVKARIAQEHPLLIFETLPKSSSTTGMLSLDELFEYGKTISYQDLPERLWATTGYRMSEPKRFIEFGKLRNSIVHFAAPNVNCADETLRFAFEIIDPMLEDFWDDSVVPYAVEWDDVIVIEGYLEEQLQHLGINKLTAKTQRVLAGQVS